MGEVRDIREMGYSHPVSRQYIEDRDSDMLQAFAIIADWSWEARTKKTSVDEEAQNFRRDTNAACDASMLHCAPGVRQDGNAYWWTPEIAELRARKLRARRRFQRARRRQHHDEQEISLCYEAYREARQILQQTIKDAKAQFLTGLVQSADFNPSMHGKHNTL